MWHSSQGKCFLCYTSCYCQSRLLVESFEKLSLFFVFFFQLVNDDKSAWPSLGELGEFTSTVSKVSNAVQVITNIGDSNAASNTSVAEGVSYTDRTSSHAVK